MEGLFSALDMEDPTAEHRAGFRLERLEVLNWGTFDRRVWTFDLAGNNALLTGDIGSGKSTLVDAVTTLLLPSQRISYNKAAGAETRERTLRSYVLGHHKSERSETTGTSRPVGLRGSSSYSAIVGVFVNRGYDETVSLAQVFWTREGDGGQPQRFFVTAGRDLSVARDLSGFGADVSALKKRLRARGDHVRDHFPEYGKDLRRSLGIASEQALELFHQTVSLKSVGDLNDFVRSHMLEPFDSATWTDRLVGHFEDLTRAHEAVLKAKEQLGHLDPLLQDCDRHDELGTRITALAGQRSAVRFFCAETKATLLADRIASLDSTLARQQSALDEAKEHLRDLTERRERLQLERAGLGGDRLAELERALADDERTRDARRARFDRYHELLAEAGLDPVSGGEEFERRQAEVGRLASGADETQSGLQNRLTEVAVRGEELKREAQDVNAELLSLRARRSNIPKHSLDLRERLCGELCLTEAELPFAGELVAIRDDASEWEGAAERLLRGFGLSLLVRAEHYPEVSDWINDHHLGTRLVYYRVPANLGPDTGRGDLSPRALAMKLQIKDSPFFAWLERELANRAAHECVETMDEFRRAAKAVTRQGQVKGPGGRHEKDDVTRIGDRRSYVLGWTNEQKVDVLLEQAGAVHTALSSTGAEQERLRRALSEAVVRQNVLGKLDEYRSFAELDWQAMVNRIAAQEAEKRRIEESSGELSRIARELDDVAGAMSDAETQRDALTGDVARAEAERGAAGRELGRVRGTLDDPGLRAARDHFEELQQRFGADLPSEPGELDRFESQARDRLTELLEDDTRRQSTLASRIVGRMRDFRIRYPLDTAEFDDSVQSMGEYRALHDRLVGDDLPRFEAEFKSYLNTNTIRDIATFQSQLNKQRELIRSRIETINESLAGIAYNPDRYITLEAHPTPNAEIRDFRSDLRACTESSLGADETEQYSEEKFLQVKRIVERFKGREGQTDADRAWTQRVTDVRNWFVFSACERWEADGSEYETYTDSGGKSGGQKEKLAYTILAASLAYQFKLEWGVARSRDFRFVVIDEAFGRGSDESTRFALQLFRRLGLQLLIVTPLQKIHVIEPFVSAVGYVDNRSGAYSRLQTLTIEEYRERRQRATGALARVTLDPEVDTGIERAVDVDLEEGIGSDVDAEPLTADALGGR